MRIRPWMMFVGAAASIPVMATLVIVVADTPEREIARIRRDIEFDLPIGSTKKAVEAWLEQREISHRPVGDHAMWGEMNREYISTYAGELTLAFNFDEQDRLVNYAVWFYDWPL